MKDKYDWMNQYASLHQIQQNYQPIGTASGTSSVYQNFPNMMPLAMQVASKTVGFDLVSVQPISMPTGQLSYIDFKYGEKDRKKAIEYLLEELCD